MGGCAESVDQSGERVDESCSRGGGEFLEGSTTAATGCDAFYSIWVAWAGTRAE